ncbi:hypothetical protein HYC85_016188 [Camellia sinensis]|uniref:Uncharacterized protein n=1 Tax=Camellia sinensis TaxID=4442 RepID=A0A7J7GZ55_CAMSI|nr:hypothetical protein HYC85_016188 [Camellia sinensis]
MMIHYLYYLGLRGGSPPNLGFTSSPAFYCPASSSHSTRWRRVATTDLMGEKGATSMKLKRQTKRHQILLFWPNKGT